MVRVGRLDIGLDEVQVLIGTELLGGLASDSSRLGCWRGDDLTVVLLRVRRKRIGYILGNGC